MTDPPSTVDVRTVGLVETPLSLSHEELTALPLGATLCDIHCVTRWSKLDNR